MDLRRARLHLNEIGITDAVLRAGDVDPTDPESVRSEVQRLLADAVAENLITDMVGLVRLQQALAALTPGTQRRRDDVVASAIRGDLIRTGVLRLVPAGMPARSRR